MVNITELELKIRDSVGSEVRLLPYGLDSYHVVTPFAFDDGDNFTIILEKAGNAWKLTDEGNTLMHLSYEMDVRDLSDGNRAKIIENVLNRHNVKTMDGAYILSFDENLLGPAVFEYIQALLHVTDISYLNREIVRSTFIEDFKSQMIKDVPDNRLTFDWHNQERDPQANYSVDCRVNGMARPLMIFAVNNDDKARDSTITVHQFEKWNMKFNAIAVFEDQKLIQRSVLARLSDVFDKQFSSLTGNEERISSYLGEIVSPQ